MPIKSVNFLRPAIKRFSSTQAAAIDHKPGYYQKIGYKAIDDLNNEVPENWKEAKQFKEIPGPKPLPLIGNLWRFLPGGEYYKIELIELHRRFVKQYGQLAYLSGLPGKRPFLCAYNPDDIEQTLRNEGPWPIRYGLPSFVYYRTHMRQDIFQGVGGVLTVQGKEWFEVRSAVNKIIMQPRTAEMYVESMDQVANELVENIRKLAAKNSDQEMPDDFQNELYKWALESIGVITFNKKLGCLNLNNDSNSEGQRLINSSIEMFELVYQLDVLPSLWPVISTKNWRKFVKILDYFTDTGLKYIDECSRATTIDPLVPEYEKSVLERLIKIDKRVATAMTIDMLIAGTDTTGRTLASALYFLAKNPCKQQALRRELKRFMPSKHSLVTKGMLQQVPYLKAVIKETTRLAPISVANLRTTIKNTVLSGYQIPKGTDILTVNIIPCQDETHFIKPQEFIPERWLRTTQGQLSYKNTHPFVHLPFGFGPRSCIGKRLANLELEVAISKIVRNFELSWHRPEATFATKLLYGIVDPLKIKMEELTN